MIMTHISAMMVQELRSATGAGMMDCKKALTEASGDAQAAAEILRKKMGSIAAKKADRATNQGWIGHYVHNNGKIGVLVEVACETDFVAKNDKFQEFIRNLAMQIAAMNPKAIGPEDLDSNLVEKERTFHLESVQDKPGDMQEKIVDGKLRKWFEEVCLLQQKYVKDDKMTVADYLQENIGTLGENMSIRRFVRYEMGAS